MTTFTIDADDNITAFPTPDHAEGSVGSGAQAFSSQAELEQLAGEWPGDRLVGIWNSLPGVVAVKKFQSRKTAIGRIWARIQGMAQEAETGDAGTTVAQKGPTKGKLGKKAKAHGRKRPAKGQATEPREGSKAARVVALLRRKNGVTLVEIMQTMGWQRHTVRGFMAGAMKKAGYAIESFKPEGGERTYRLGK